MALLRLSGEDRKTLITHLHPELKSGIITVGGIALENIGKVFLDDKIPRPETFDKTAEAIVMSSVTDGYLAFLVDRGIDPTTAKLGDVVTTSGLGQAFMASFQKDKHQSRIAGIDPVFGLMLTAVYEVRSNQLLSEFPGSVEYPYRVTEKMNQYLRWSIVMGYVLGILEEELSHGERSGDTAN